jgi:protein gp37
MYPWVTHTHSHLEGKCPHECGYCYVQAMSRRFPTLQSKYSGPVRLNGAELNVCYGKGRTIFIDCMNDLWAAQVEKDWIDSVLEHCRAYPLNTYVFQTKNPQRYHEFAVLLPKQFILGTTIETTRADLCPPTAPKPFDRAYSMSTLPSEWSKFVTIEPVLEFDLVDMVEWLKAIKPTFVNIGADSKGHGLKEPTGDQLRALIAMIQAAGIEIRQKHNLERLLTTTS